MGLWQHQSSACRALVHPRTHARSVSAAARRSGTHTAVAYMIVVWDAKRLRVCVRKNLGSLDAIGPSKDAVAQASPCARPRGALRARQRPGRFASPGGARLLRAVPPC